MKSGHRHTTPPVQTLLGISIQLISKHLHPFELHKTNSEECLLCLIYGTIVSKVTKGKGHHVVCHSLAFTPLSMCQSNRDGNAD